MALYRIVYHHHKSLTATTGGRGFKCSFSGLVDFNDYLNNNLNNHEKSGVPKGAGTDSHHGFDLGRMKRLMQSLGNPQSKYKVTIFTTLRLTLILF